MGFIMKFPHKVFDFLPLLLPGPPLLSSFMYSIDLFFLLLYP